MKAHRGMRPARSAGDYVVQCNVQPSMTKSSAESDTLLLRSIALVGVLVLIAVFATDVILREVVSPEIGLAYLTFASIKTLPEALSKFFSVRETWYRPGRQATPWLGVLRRQRRRDSEKTGNSGFSVL